MTKPTQAQIENAFQYDAQARAEFELAVANGEAEAWDWAADFEAFQAKQDEEHASMPVKQSKPVDMIEQVYAELKANDEGGGSVFLDNVNLRKLGITEQQFSGYCAALTKQGRYKPASDKAFGIVI
jgi:hypothetical protein